MSTTAARPDVLAVTSVDEAVQQLASLGDDGAPLAGGTWIMRAPLRDERLLGCYVALDRLDELRQVDFGAETVQLGAQLTHAQLARLMDVPALAGLATAAARSAFPAIRNVATLGGNIRALGFAEADLVPAALAAEASVTLRTPEGEAALDLESYLRERHARPPGELLLRVTVPTPPGRRAAYERLTVRGGAEYSVASVAVGVDVADGVVTSARVALGSVEPEPRLCRAAAEALVGGRLTADSAEAAGRAAAAECTGRDGLDAPGWYREAVLPALLRRAVTQISDVQETAA
jgi:carbon-monoxide dehydrogenase medium subunit